MNTASLQDENGYFKIAAMDHRGSLEKIMEKERIPEFKALLAQTFAPISTAVLVDPQYGHKAIEITKANNLGLLLSREESGYTESQVGRTTTLLQDQTAESLKAMGATAIKLLLYYNPEAQNSDAQIETVKKVYEEAHAADLPLLVEPITYKLEETEGESFHKGDSVMKAITDLRDYADVLKMEYPAHVPQGTKEEEFDQIMEEAWPYLKAMTEEAKKPWVLLSRGMPFMLFEKAVQESKDAGASGYAVGRAVWQEVSNLESWELKENFINTTAKDRMEKLSNIYGI